MNVKLSVLSAGALFFLGQNAFAQKTKSDSTKTKDIQEVVVIGYQKKSKDDVTSAVSTISGESLSKLSPTTMGANALQGKAAGVDISAFSGRPGSGAKITIRGLANLTTSSNSSDGVLSSGNPLFVIDGFVLGADSRAQEVFNSINPNDYESISVLKDAAAAAIYGSQGANGVIVLTTKKGKQGKPVITFSSKQGFSNKIKDINFRMMNSREKISYEKALIGLEASGYNSEKWLDIAKENLALAQDHNWQKDILRTSYIESYQAGIRGGSEKARYNASLGYDSDNGIVRNIHAYKRYTGRIGFEATPTDKFSMGSSVGINYSVNQEIRDRNNTQNPFRAMYDYNPYEPIFKSDGSYNPTAQGFPILEALKNNPESQSNLFIDANIFLQYKIINGLTFKTQLGGYFNNYRRTAKTLRGSFLDNILGINGAVTQQNQNRFRYTTSNTLNYVKSFGKHNFDLLGLIEYAEFKNDIISAVGRNFSSPSMSQLSNSAIPFEVKGRNQLYRTFSTGAFLTYDYDKRYVITGSIRQDADSRFGKNNVYSEPFWSVSGAWNVTNEEFLNNSDILNTLKLRASLGLRGYNNIDLNINNVLYSGNIYGGNPTLGIDQFYGNTDLKWEVTKSQNYGAEFGILKNRIKGTVDYFVDVKKDFLLQIPNYSSEGGAYSTVINAGRLTNKGLEVSLNIDILKASNGLNWSLRMNNSFMSYKLNKLTNTEHERIQGINILREGYEPFSFYLVRSAGINPDNGNEQYYTKDGNITEVYNSNDAVMIEDKSPLPKMFGGFGTSFSYKGFDLTADFTFKSGNYTYNYMALNMLNYTNGNNSNMRSDAANYWTTPGQTNVLPRPNNPSNAPGEVTGLQTTDRFLQDASYIRFRNLSVGYTFTKKIFSDLPVNKLRLSLTGQNIATWTKFEGDPEVSVGSGENQTGTNQTFISGAYALYSYPAVKTFLFGIDLEF